MKENSIRNERSSMEETIKTIEKMIKSYKEADKCGLSNNDFKNEIKSLEHILSDYRRVLKENEILNEEKEQAWEEWNNLEQGSYETEQNLKQQIKELQKENEEWEALDLRNSKMIANMSIRHFHDREKIRNSIPKQTIKGKIEEYKNMCISNADGYENYFKDNYDELVFRRMEQLEKELLGSEE